mgnify:CR=1 FL=1
MFYQIYNIHLLNGEVIQSSEDYDLPAEKGLVGMFKGMKETDLQSLAHFNKMDAHRPRIRVFDLWQAEGRNQFTVTLLNII